MKKILINATQKEEIRVALVDGQRLYDLDIESPGALQTKANIYKGKVSRIEPSLDAVFVDYGAQRHGFLSRKEVAATYWNGGKRGNGKKGLYEGQSLLVQVDKPERGTKGAALTTFICLAGSYLVLMPNNARASGISRRIEGEDRQTLKKQMASLAIPEGMGVIIRTAGVGKSVEVLQRDLEMLVRYWKAVEEALTTCTSPCLIHQESDVVSRAIRDYLRQDIEEIVIDDEDIFERAKSKIKLLKPEFIDKVSYYRGSAPLFNHYMIEPQIESAFSHEVRLPSGGSIVIDSTEALTAIDINSARATRGGDIEETAFTTNMEAADEIARQLRLRDLGGLVVIDFIDMSLPRNQTSVETCLREASYEDRARIQFGHISKFGLLELSRQRLNPSLGESSYKVCARCRGRGTLRSNASLALAILRLLESAAAQEGTFGVCAIVPINIASYLLNEKRPMLQRLEQQYHVKVVVSPDPQRSTPSYQIHRARAPEELAALSYTLPQQFDQGEHLPVAPPLMPPVPALIDTELLRLKTPVEPPSGLGIFQWIKTCFVGKEAPCREITTVDASPKNEKPVEEAPPRREKRSVRGPKRKPRAEPQPVKPEEPSRVQHQAHAGAQTPPVERLVLPISRPSVKEERPSALLPPRPHGHAEAAADEPESV